MHHQCVRCIRDYSSKISWSFKGIGGTIVPSAGSSMDSGKEGCLSAIGGVLKHTLCTMAKLLRVDTSRGSYIKNSKEPGKGESLCSSMYPILTL